MSGVVLPLALEFDAWATCDFVVEIVDDETDDPLDLTDFEELAGRFAVDEDNATTILDVPNSPGAYPDQGCEILDPPTAGLVRITLGATETGNIQTQVAAAAAGWSLTGVYDFFGYTVAPSDDTLQRKLVAGTFTVRKSVTKITPNPSP